MVSKCGDVVINVYNVPVYAAESNPTGSGNATFDSYLSNGRF